MIIHPYREPPVPPLVARLHDPYTAQLEDNTLVALDDLQAAGPAVRVFAPWDQVDVYARAGVGELVCWGEDPIRWRAGRSGDRRRRGSDVVIVKLPYPDGDEFLRGLVVWRDWLASHGASVAWSLGGTSMSLLRATLERELVTTNGMLPPARWTLGGRQQSAVEPGTEVAGAVQVDLPAAYSTTVGELRYGGVWRDLPSPEWPLLEALNEAGMPILVHGKVRLAPGLHFGPLPRRPRRRPETLAGEDWTPVQPVPYPTKGILTGLWAFEEVAAAVEAGSSFACDIAYVHVTRSGDAGYPFRGWLAACLEGRKLAGWWPGLLAKATANALWGQFVIDDSKQLQVVSFNGRRYCKVLPGSRGHQVRAWDLGEIICGRVRAKLWTMMEEAGDGLVCAHTDGGWVTGEPELGEEWRVKDRASCLQVLDQQHLRYLSADGSRWRYALSGVPAARAEEMFEKLWNVYSKGDR